MSNLPFARMQSRGFLADQRFSSAAAQARPMPDAPNPVDIETAAYERGYAEGAALAREEAFRDERERDARREAIELAFARFDEDSAQDLRDRLRQTVLALCESAVAPLAVDSDGLVARIEKAVAMLQRSDDERHVLLNPQDFAMVKDRLPKGLSVEPSASVERGGLRIETEDGGVEDGPSQWRRILAEAFREC